MDTLTRAQRSERMRRVKSRDTAPELKLRRLVWALGHRYRKNHSSVMGRPDLAFVGRKKAIFIHGCFWHRHGAACPLTRLPKSRLEFWLPKLEQNAIRDQKSISVLRRDGWSVMVVWECEIQGVELAKRLSKFLEG